MSKLRAQILIYGSGKNASCVLKSFDKETIVFEGLASEMQAFRPWETVSVYSCCQGQRLAFTARIKRNEGTRLVLSMPEKLFKAPQRKSIRVAPPLGMTVEFYLHNEKIKMDCPSSQEYLDIEMPEQNEGFDSTSIKNLLDSFKRKASSRFSKNGVIMFTDKRKPESIEERLIAQMGRCLLITSTRSPLSATDPYSEGRIITQAMADNYEGASIFMEGSELEKSRLLKAEKGIVSEIYCPILYYQYVIGYVYLMNDTSKKVCLDFSSIDFAWEFSRVLVYSLKKNNYYQTDGDTTPQGHKPKVLDLSSGGCLFALPKSIYSVQLRNSSIIELMISSDSTNISVKGKVVRRFDDKDEDFYGIAFLNLDKKQEDILKALLYANAQLRYSCNELEIPE